MASLPLIPCISSLFLLSLVYPRSLASTTPPPFKVKAVNLGGWLVTEGWMTPWLFDGIPNKDLLDGAQVQFKSVVRNTYLTAENGGGAAVAATRTVASAWETFKVWRSGSSFHFKVLNGNFIGLDDQGRDTVARSFSARPQETFQITRRSSQEPNRVRLKAPNGLFLQVRDGSVTADAQESTSWGEDDPSVFDMTIVKVMQGEFQLTNGYGRDKASMVLNDHWNKYIRDDDFYFLFSNGINAVRIPVGYWIAEDNNPPWPYVGGSLAFLDKAFDWAEKYGINVIVDLHAARGSQNGNDHGGSRDGSQEWGKTDKSIAETVEAIDFLANRYGRRPGLLAMELINEPWAPGVRIESLMKYYKAGYDAVRAHSGCYVIMSNRLGPHEATELLGFASGLDGTVIDVHYYNLYSDFFTKMSVQQNIDYVRTNRAAGLRALTLANGPLVFVGEWTAHLEGASDQDAQRFAAAELGVFGEATFGWAYWSYKNVNHPQWSLRHMILHGLIKLKN